MGTLNRGIKATWTRKAQVDFEKSDHEEVLRPLGLGPQRCDGRQGP